MAIGWKILFVANSVYFADFRAATGSAAKPAILLLWPPCVADADIICLPCSFYGRRM